jgi:hypothetical protein
MSSHVGTVFVGGFSPEEKAVVEEPGGQPCDALRTLTFFVARQAPVHADPTYPSSPL